MKHEIKYSNEAVYELVKIINDLYGNVGNEDRGRARVYVGFLARGFRGVEFRNYAKKLKELVARGKHVNKDHRHKYDKYGNNDGDYDKIYQFLYKTSRSDIPLWINDDYIKLFYFWRLEIES